MNTSPLWRHRPWVMVWPLSLAQLISWGTLYFSFPLLLEPMQRELGWSRPALSGALTLGLLVTGLCAYRVGAWLDQHGGRGVMTLGSLGAGLCLLAWSGVHALWQFYLLWCVLGVFLSCCLIEPLFAVVNHVFADQARAGLTAVTLVTGLSSTIFVPLLGYLVPALTWRPTLELLAALNLFINVPVHWWFIPPLARGAGPPHRLAERRGVVVMRQRLRNPVFWGLALWFTSYSLTANSLLFQYLPVLRAEHVPEVIILSSFALIGPVQVISRIVIVTVARHSSIARLGAFTSALTPLAVLVLIMAPHRPFWLCMFAACFATAHGITTILRGTAPAEWLGREYLARTMGAIAMPMMVAMAIAPSLTSWVWELSGSSRAMLWLVLAGAVVGHLGYWVAVLSRRRAIPSEPGRGQRPAGR